MKPMTTINGKTALIQCVVNDDLGDLNIKDNCFLLLMIREGSVYFQVGDITFEAIAPCFVCFDEKQSPAIIRNQNVKCNSIYFHPQFLNINMTFERVHSVDYEQIANRHDMFLLLPFTDQENYVFPIYPGYSHRIFSLFSAINEELREQHDWYWSCRSRSFFMEIVLILERSYGITGRTLAERSIEKIIDLNLKNAIIYIESHYQEEVTLQNISKAAATNHSTLTKLFKAECGVTPIEYLWRHRVTVAKKHLEFTDLPVKEIALRCGFKNVQHFCRKFGMYTGFIPSDFRKEAVERRKGELI